MYHPYIRGKQYELILLRENADLIKESSIIPIIEPVKQNLSPLNKALEKLIEKQAKFILIVNPKHGDHKDNPSPIFKDTIDTVLNDYGHFSIGYIVDAQSELSHIKSFLEENESKSVVLIHNGFPKAKDLAQVTESFTNIKKHIFINKQSGKLYQKQFKKDSISRVLIRDGFIKKKNREYPPKEHFSDLHITYDDESMDAFGDFLIVGDDYSESGGPAYAIAIHLTYLEEDEDMYIRHFISDRYKTPADPAGKFAEALKKLVEIVEEDESLVFKSKAYFQFKKFYDNEHFPGLGYVKKLSMQHHLELVSKFLSEQ